jgi:hypothetical protein
MSYATKPDLVPLEYQGWAGCWEYQNSCHFSTPATRPAYGNHEKIWQIAMNANDRLLRKLSVSGTVIWKQQPTKEIGVDLTFGAVGGRQFRVNKYVAAHFWPVKGMCMQSIAERVDIRRELTAQQNRL